MDRKDCFAYYQSLNGEAQCSALNTKDCFRCKFYRNDLSRKGIEIDIKKYGGDKNESV